MKKVLYIYPSAGKKIDLVTDILEVIPATYDIAKIIEDEKDNEVVWDSLVKGWSAIEGIDVVLIDRNVLIEDAVIIMAHFRLSSHSPRFLNIPILYFSISSLRDLLSNSGIEYIEILIYGNIEYFWEGEVNTDEELIIELSDIINNLRFSDQNNLKYFKAYPKKLGSSHQVTNEWGAFKLAYTAELFYLLPIIENELKNTYSIYFKYLKYRDGIQTHLLSKEKLIAGDYSKKYLLIDDNYNRGWYQVFGEVLKQVDSTLGLDAYEELEIIESNLPVALDNIKKSIVTNKYHGVLLDLRLVSEDENSDKKNTDISQFTGGLILKAIKGWFPYLPVIMVTASNKAWNMEQLIDTGADGYYIKEDPESNPSPEVSKTNYENFKKTILSSIDKYNKLYPFWKYISLLQPKSTLISEREVEIEESNGTKRKEFTKVEERVLERLKMFFGLIKRKFEDTTYNKIFYYSDVKLAFMTLWSCLNDIQYIYYDKSEDQFLTSSGKLKSSIKVENCLVSKLAIPSTSNVYLQKKNTQNNRFTTKLKVDYNLQNGVYSIDTTQVFTKDFTSSIGEQIAFLILTISSSSSIKDLSSGQRDVNKLCDNLVMLKNKRNHLYLTHGDESPDNDFFQKLEKENTEVKIDDCAILFEIVYFLLKGELIQIKI